MEDVHVSTTIKKHECPVCYSPNDAFTSALNENRVPQKGDIAICAYCTSVLEIDENLQCSVASQETLDQLQKDDPETFELILNSIQMLNTK